MTIRTSHMHATLDHLPVLYLAHPSGLVIKFGDLELKEFIVCVLIEY